MTDYYKYGENKDDPRNDSTISKTSQGYVYKDEIKKGGSSFIILGIIIIVYMILKK